MKKENWIVTLDEVFYYKDYNLSGENWGFEFTPYIECAKIYNSEEIARGELEQIIANGDFKDSRGHVTPTTSFGMRKMTRKDYNEIKKRQDAKSFFRKKEQGAA